LFFLLVEDMERSSFSLIEFNIDLEAPFSLLLLISPRFAAKRGASGHLLSFRSRGHPLLLINCGSIAGQMRGSSREQCRIALDFKSARRKKFTQKVHAKVHAKSSLGASRNLPSQRPLNRIALRGAREEAAGEKDEGIGL